jgi:hypothetical protein
MAPAKLKKVSVADGVSVKLPDGFVRMSDDDMAVKYPSTKKPVAMFSSLDRMVDFGLNVTKSNWAGNDLNLLKEVYKSTLYTLFSEVSILKEEVRTVNKNDFVVLEFTSYSDHVRKYTYLQYGIFNNRVYIFNFTCPAKMQPEWQAIAEEIMNSVKVKTRKLLPVEYNPSGKDNEMKGKSPQEVLEEQKRRRQINKTTTGK